jgi:hypothetical protein
MRLKFPLPASAAVAAALFVTLAAPPAASAQTAPRVTFTPVAPPSSPATPALSQAADNSYWEVIGGLEFDTDGMMYGFFGPQWTRPLNGDVAVFARAYGNWLQYEFEENGGTTEVSGPGISTQVGLKFGDRNTFKVGAGPSFKWRGETFTDAAGGETELDSDMEVGFSVGADAYLNPTDRDNVHAIVNYDTADDYLWSRLAYKHQITNHGWQDTWAHYVGAEGILQGNDDIRTLMLGGLVDFVHAPSRTSLMLRAGFKRSSFDTADDRTGPYFGINFYKRLGQ